MTTHCENCNQSLQDLWHKQNEALSAIIEVCDKKLSYANRDITNKIVTYIEKHGYHDVYSKRKIRIPYPEPTGDPEEDEDLEERINEWHVDCGYYLQGVSVRVCRHCFIRGILCSLKTENRLPFLRNHIGYFKINENSQYDTVSKDEIKEASRKMILPKSYTCDFYRSQQPINLNDESKFIVIKSN
tara:strand:- start:25 stop:582 length:558 start_codon:yes stop_codon:yes gene_type:complete